VLTLKPELMCFNLTKDGEKKKLMLLISLLNP